MPENAREDDSTLHFQLDLCLERRPITGTLRTEQGAEERFVGWLGFVSALARLAPTDELSARGGSSQ
jgi:hypothetical protein